MLKQQRISRIVEVGEGRIKSLHPIICNTATNIVSNKYETTRQDNIIQGVGIYIKVQLVLNAHAQSCVLIVMSWYVQNSVDDALAQELDGLDVRVLRPANTSSFKEHNLPTTN